MPGRSSPSREVLVVDDAADVRVLLRAVLSQAGYEVTEAAGAVEAIAALRNGRPDLVLLDVQMPEHDGWQTLTAIRADTNTAEVPVVMCTARSAPADEAYGWRLGCDGYLTKPFAIADLLGTVSAVLDRSPKQRDTLRRRMAGKARRLEEVES